MQSLWQPGGARFITTRPFCMSILLLQVLAAVVLVGLITECTCFKSPLPSLTPKECSPLYVLHRQWKAKAEPSPVRSPNRRVSAGNSRSVPTNLFTRTSPLRVRLEYRGLASQYTAYDEHYEGRSPTNCVPGEGDETRVSDEVFHIVFSYDPSVVSVGGKGPFRYLEGQSISFLNVIDTRKCPLKEAPVRPRLYSVASSPVSPELGLQHCFSLCVRHHRYWTQDGRRDPSRDGVCSSQLCTAPIGTEFEVGGPVGTALLMPEDTSTPLVFACTGTGAAPLRSFLRRATVEGREGPLVAYIGATKASATPYAREWDYLQKVLPANRLQIHYAYSRKMTTPQGGKLYVQHLMERDGDRLLELLKGGAVLYACGRKDMLPPIKAALRAAAEKNNLQFEPLFKELVATRRWRTEVY